MNWSSLQIIPPYLERGSRTQALVPVFRTRRLCHLDGTYTSVVDLFQYPGMAIRSGAYNAVIRFIKELKKRVCHRRIQTKLVSDFWERRILGQKTRRFNEWLRITTHIQRGYFQLYSKSILTRYFGRWYVNYLHSKATTHRVAHIRSKSYRQKLNLGKKRMWRIWVHPVVQKRRACAAFKLKLLTQHFSRWKLAYIARKNQDLLEEFVYYQIETIHLTFRFQCDEWKDEKGALVIGDLVRSFNFQPLRELTKVNPGGRYTDIEVRLSLIQRALKSQTANWLDRPEEDKPGILNKHQIRHLLRKHHRSPRPFLLIFKHLKEKRLGLAPSYILYLIYIHLESSIVNMRKLVVLFRTNLAKYRQVEVSTKYQDVVLLRQLQQLQTDIYCSPATYLQGTSRWSQLHVIYDLPVLSLTACCRYLTGMLSTTITGKSTTTRPIFAQVSAEVPQIGS
jgi:hypothetical protein